MAGLPSSRSLRSRGTGGNGGSRAKPTAAVRPRAGQAMQRNTRSLPSCTRAASPMDAVSGIAIAAGIAGLIWLAVMIALRLIA